MENKPSGILLDTGPLFALLIKGDAEHEHAKKLFSRLTPPFRTCEAVISEVCFLMRKSPARGLAPAELISLAMRGFFEISFSLKEQQVSVHSLFQIYQDQDISLADACLIRMAEMFDEPRIVTLDSDFKIYRWDKNKRFICL